MRRLIGSALLAFAVACGGDKATGPGASVTGNYLLSSVNGISVPAVVLQNSIEKDELTAGNINLNSDKTWSGSLSARSTQLATGLTSTISVPANGTYTTSGSAITLTDASDGSKLTGSLVGGTLSLSADLGLGVPLVLLFKK